MLFATEPTTTKPAPKTFTVIEGGKKEASAIDAESLQFEDLLVAQAIMQVIEDEPNTVTRATMRKMIGWGMNAMITFPEVVTQQEVLARLPEEMKKPVSFFQGSNLDAKTLAAMTIILDCSVWDFLALKGWKLVWTNRINKLL